VLRVKQVAMITVPEPSEFALTDKDEMTEVYRHAIGPRELENQASDTHAEMQRVRIRIHAEADFESRVEEIEGAVFDRGVDPFIGNGGRRGNGDGNVGSVNVDGEIAVVGKVLTIGDGCHSFSFFCNGD